MSAASKKKAASLDADEKIPPTPPGVLAILIVILIGLMIATGYACFYPSVPSSWKTIHETPNLPMAQVNDILSKSGASVDSIKQVPDGTLETWQFKHRTGTWTIEVKLKKTPTGVVYSSEKVSCYITNFPSFTRTWEYPAADPAATPPAEDASKDQKKEETAKAGQG